MKEERESGKKHDKITETIFWRQIMNNRFVSGLFILLLFFLTLFVFTKVSHLFTPVAQIFSIIGTPILFAILFYYLLIPIVRYFERRGLARSHSVGVVFLGMLVIIALAITYILPGLRDQFRELINNFPRIWTNVSHQIEQLLYDEWLTEIYQGVQETQILTRISEQLSNIFTVTLESITSAIGILTKISLTILTLPFILYYLLTDGDRFKKLLLKYTPTRKRPIMRKFITQASDQVGSYVRGELLVAISVMIMFYIGYRIIDLEYALVLSISAGVLNLIPYLGSIISAIPAVIIGAFVSPFKLLQVLMVLAVEQFIEGRFISPQILGNSLDIHPLVILFILLVSGNLFGFTGLLFGVPGFAVLRVIWKLFFEWIKNNYDYYTE